MSNYNNNNTEEENCLVCQKYDDFKELIRESVSVEDAFHVTFSELAMQLIEDVSEINSDESYNKGYEDGIIEGIESVALNALNAAEGLQKQFEVECSCGESEACSDCPCDSTPCNCPETYIVDVEVRRAAYEDF